MRRDLLAFAALALLGAGWGLGSTMTKLAVTEGHRGFGIVFWWQAIGLVLMAAICHRRGRGLVWSGGALRLYLVIALTGAVIPGYASVTAVEVLPVGIMVLVVSTTPLMAMAIALGLGRERPEAGRLLGLAFGLAAMAMVALPGTSLPERAMLAALPVALVTPFCYAVEANAVGRYADLGLDPVQALLGAFVVGVALTLPLALGEGSFVVPAPTPGQAAIAFAAVLNAAAYVGYVWLVGRAGAVFAAQVAYLVTGFGLVWAMLLLGERYSVWVWAAFAALIAGLALVQPRPRLPRPVAGA